ncbi:phosphoribosyl-AMP cyclohydrolase [Sediminitomix flava]|uniref:Histidine biosynthesis bifunctional protein HisIE n=1 Tax=Sediminitomix flava TaxID=379075 RepID=A0A315ZF51_SEDFL|nr:phosphoribosyl-AMP cyclohydrolase [Sediminitomix flava]PWJ44141.1 phosphoribosyl-AMP cyclohydrolase [Sediminitomix flava]
MNKLEEGDILSLQFEKRNGLLPVVVQEVKSKEILMLGYANKEAFEETLRSKYATFWSTSRNELWTKGLTSGDTLKVVEIRVDCDQDAIIYIVEKEGRGACHTKSKKGTARTSCFYRKMNLTEEEGELEFIEK